jgi:hypothetical protein
MKPQRMLRIPVLLKQCLTSQHDSDVEFQDNLGILVRRKRSPEVSPCERFPCFSSFRLSAQKKDMWELLHLLEPEATGSRL